MTSKIFFTWNHHDFLRTYQKYNDEFSNKDTENFHVFDSTIMSLSGKLLKDGINVGGKLGDRHIKVTVSLRRSIPSSVRLCELQSEASEDVALVAAINDATVAKEDILLFDRGISKAATFQQLDKEEKKIVTRIKQNRKYEVVRRNEIGFIRLMRTFF